MLEGTGEGRGEDGANSAVHERRWSGKGTNRTARGGGGMEQREGTMGLRHTLLATPLLPTSLVPIVAMQMNGLSSWRAAVPRK